MLAIEDIRVPVVLAIDDVVVRVVVAVGDGLVRLVIRIGNVLVPVIGFFLTVELPVDVMVVRRLVRVVLAVVGVA